MKGPIAAACAACLAVVGGVPWGAAQQQPVAGLPTDHAGLIAYWPCDEGKGTGVADAGPRKLGGELRGGKWVPGVKGTALRFEADGDHLDYGESPELNFPAGAAFTFAGWVRTQGQSGTVVSQRNKKDGGAVIDITVEGGNLVALVRQDKKEDGRHAKVIGGPVADGAWHHFALTRDTGTGIELFIDGASAGKGQGADAGGAITTDLRAVGFERRWAMEGVRTPQGRLVGDVDDFCIYGRALTAAELRRLAGPPRTVVAKNDPPKGTPIPMKGTPFPMKGTPFPMKGDPPPADAARYTGSGATFDYTRGWKLTTDKAGPIATITVQNDAGTQAMVQIHPPGADPKTVRSTMEGVFRKGFEGKAVAGSDKAVNRKFGATERAGQAVAFEVAKDVAINFEFYAFPLGEREPVVCVVFQHAAFDATAAKAGFDRVAGSIRAVGTK